MCILQMKWNWCSVTGYSQVTEWASLMEGSCCSFQRILSQPVQSFLASQKQASCGWHMVGHCKWPEHLHRVSTKQPLHSSSTSWQRGRQAVEEMVSYSNCLCIFRLCLLHWMNVFDFIFCRCSFILSWVCSTHGPLSNPASPPRVLWPASGLSVTSTMTLHSGEKERLWRSFYTHRALRHTYIDFFYQHI